MAKSIQAILSPLLTISYVCGLRIAEFSADRDPRSWFSLLYNLLSLLYNLLLWSIYYFFLITTVISSITADYPTYSICIWLQLSATLVTIFFGMYHNKTFKDCLKKLAIVDDTIEELGMTTDYQKLRTRLTWVISGWIIIILLLNYGDTLWWQSTYDIIISGYMSLMLNYCSHVHILDELVFLSTLGYLGLKFDQINQHLRELTDGKYAGNGRVIKRPSKDHVLCSQQRESPNTTLSNRLQWTIWIVIHLHLELCRVSREINSIFGIQLTLKMAIYFLFIAELFRELFSALFDQAYPDRKLYIITIAMWLLLYLVRVFLINFMCERISSKAKATSNFINRVSSSACNMEIRENIVQLILQITQAPLKFYGLGLFQFGFKFFCGYFEYILTFLIILIQANEKKYIFKYD